jgi:copper resistance protein C
MKRLIALATGLLLLATPIANAHTTLVSSSPKSNAMLTKSPTSISITFDDPLIKISGKNVSKISLSSTLGAINLGPTAINKGTISAPIIKSLSAGKYTVKYRVVSADGHPVSGSFNFWVH